MTRIVLTVVALCAVYALTLASAHPLDLAAGAVVAGLVLVALRRFVLADQPPPARVLAGRMIRFPRFAGAVLVEVVRGTWTVALVVTGLRRLARPGIVAVPIGDRTPAGVAVSALAVTLSPGEVFVDVDWSRGLMLLHVIDAADADAVRRHHALFYDRYQRGVFP